MRSSSVVLLSGGLDSLAAFHWAHKESDITLAVTFHYGQQAALKEIECASRICHKYDIAHKVIDLPWYSQLKPNALLNGNLGLPEFTPKKLEDPLATQQSARAVWIANRNGVFLNVAASIAEDRLANWIVMGFNAEEAQTFPDNSKEFVQVANQFFKYSTSSGVEVRAPMENKTKTEIVAWALQEKVDLSLVWSCYRGLQKMCGVCESCARLKRALASNQANSWSEVLF